jgi:hypothetical protein
MGTTFLIKRPVVTPLETFTLSGRAWTGFEGLSSAAPSSPVDWTDSGALRGGTPKTIISHFFPDRLRVSKKRLLTAPFA